MNKVAEHNLTKLYYTIGEVAEMFDVNTSLIRFWEKEFQVISPKKNRKGNRLFTPKDIVNINKKLLRTYEINIGHIKHFKEKSILNQRIGNTTPYIFGKLNRLYVLRPMIGVSKTISEKKSKNNIGVTYFGGIGPIIGFLKPVYVDIDIFDTSGINTSSSLSVRYNPLTTPQNRILGYSSFGKGIKDTKIISGICFKSGISFDWGTYRSDFKSIEIGIQLDYFPSRPKIMDEIKNKTIFSGFYISFAFGKNY